MSVTGGKSSLENRVSQNSNGHLIPAVAVFVVLCFGLPMVSAVAYDPMYVSYDPDTMTFVVSPTGTDDTSNIQDAFDSCVDLGPGCTVELTAGQFYVSQVIANGFHGTFKGAGMGVTKIDVPGPETVPNYTPPDFVPSEEEPEAPASASMIVFEGGGNIEVSDMSFDITEEHPAELHLNIHWPQEPDNNWLDHIIKVTYRPPTDFSPDEGVSVDSVGFKSLYGHPGLPWGINVRCNLRFGGTSITDDDYTVVSTPFTGTHSVTNSIFDGAGMGVESGGLVNGSLSIGGGPGIGSEFANDNVGVLVLDSDGSQFEVSHNAFDNNVYNGVRLMQRSGQPRYDRALPYFRAPAEPYEAVVAYNDFQVSGWEDGIAVLDLGPEFGIYGNLKASLHHNNMVLNTYQYWGGAFVYYALDTDISNNYIRGSGNYGIWVTFGNGIFNRNEIKGTNNGIVLSYPVVPGGEIAKNKLRETSMGIRLRNAFGVTVNQNEIFKSEISGIVLTEGSSINMVQKNEIKHSGMYDLYWDETGIDNEWKDNVCTTSSPDGLCD